MQDATVDGEEPILNGAGREEVRRGRVCFKLVQRHCKYSRLSNFVRIAVLCIRIPSVSFTRHDIIKPHDASYFSVNIKAS